MSTTKALTHHDGRSSRSRRWPYVSALALCGVMMATPLLGHDFGGRATPPTDRPKPRKPKDPDCAPDLVQQAFQAQAQFLEDHPLLAWAADPLGIEAIRAKALSWVDARVAEYCNRREAPGFIGDPVSPFSGHENTSTMDLYVDGVFPIAIIRQYDSQSGYDSPVGRGWSLTHDIRLYKYPDDSVVIRRGAGRLEKFVDTGAGLEPESAFVAVTLTHDAVSGTYTATLPMSATAEFDARGRMTALVDPKGNELQFQYSPDRRPLMGTSSASLDPSEPLTVALNYQLLRIDEVLASGQATGRFVTFQYDGATGRLDSITANDGREVSYSHAPDGSGNLVKVTDAVGIEYYYDYDDPDDSRLITSIQNGKGTAPFTFTYDDDGRIETHTHGNDSYEFFYDDPVSYSTRVEHTITDDAGLNPVVLETIYEYNAEGIPTKQIDHEKNEFRSVIGPEGLIDAEEVWVNTGTRENPNLVLDRTTTYTNLPDSFRREVTLDSGETVYEEFEYDQKWLRSHYIWSSISPQQFGTEWEFDRDGPGPNDPITGVRWVKHFISDGVYQEWEYDHNANGRPNFITLPDGTKIVSTYFPDGSPKAGLLERMYLEVDGEELPQRASQFDYDARGNVQSATDARGKTYTFEYDSIGRLTKITNPLGEETILTYTGPDLIEPGMFLTMVEVGHTAAEGEGIVTRYLYNAMGQVEGIERKDEQGTWVRLATFASDSAGRLLRSTTAGGSTTSFQYDTLGHLSSVKDPEDRIWELTHDPLGELIEETDPLHNRTHHTYDDLGRVIKVEALDTSPVETTEYSYDAAGNLRSVKDARGFTTTYNRDSLSRLTSIDRPLLPSVQFFYDDTDRLDYVINARGNKIDYSYYDWGPMETLQFFETTSSPTPSRTVAFTYDNEGNLLTVVDDAVQATPSYSWTYDDLNRVDKELLHYLPSGKAILDFDYLRYGGLARLVFWDPVLAPSVHDFSNVNKLGLLDDFSLPNGDVHGLTYNSDFDLESVTYPSGVSLEIGRNKNGEADHLTWRDSTQATLETFDYGINDLGLADSVTTSDGLHGFQYNEVQELTQATHPASTGLPTTEDFGYDPLGNREDPQDPSAYQYDANNRLTEVNGVAYGYDDDGNLTSTADGRVLAYDEAGDLTGYSDASSSASYLYDIFGRRIKKDVNGTQTWFVWDGAQLLGEYDASGIRRRRYAYGLGLGPVQYETEGEWYEVHADRNGAPRMLTDISGEIVWNAAFSAYGGAVINEDVDGDRTNVAYPWRFPGQYKDEESGFYYNYLRYYDPSIGRYVQPDPLGQYGDLAYYAYAQNDPVNSVDPLGLLGWKYRCFDLTFNAGERWAEGQRDRAIDQMLDHNTSAIGKIFYWGEAALFNIWTPCSSNQTAMYAATAIPIGRGLARVLRGARVPAPKGAGLYLAKKAPNQVTPGLRVLEGNYVDDLGRVQPWRAHYDEYGRLIGRTDFNAGNRAAGIPDTHFHRYEYNSQFSGGREVQRHVPGEFPGDNR